MLTRPACYRCRPGARDRHRSGRDGRAGLAWLAGADAAALTTSEQAECLHLLEQAESAHTAARASVLAAFRAADGCRDDGHPSAKTWLRWKTQITPGAATGAMKSMRRLAAHPLVRGALADAKISTSWARQICAWTDKVPAEVRDDADSVLPAAARGGMDLEDIGGLAEEIRRHTARPDTDGPDDGFDDRSVSLQTTFGGAGTLRGNLAPSCAAALSAVLDSLGKRAGPKTCGHGGSVGTTPWKRRAACSWRRTACRTGPASRRKSCFIWIWTGCAGCRVLPTPKRRSPARPPRRGRSVTRRSCRS